MSQCCILSLASCLSIFMESALLPLTMCGILKAEVFKEEPQIFDLLIRF